MAKFNPALTKEQIKASSRTDYPPVPKVCAVTGGTGFVGTRLCEMLIERGAEKVISFDIVPKEKAILPWNDSRIKYVVGDISNYDDVYEALKGVECVWHLAAAVGPFHPKSLYQKVNYGGTVNVIRACKAHGIRKLVFSSSPSTRFKGSLFHRPNVDGLREEDMPGIPLQNYMQMYAATKAQGELAVREAISDDFWAIAVAPHQVYGPRDNLFLPNMLEAAGTGKLRIFGHGENRICFSHVDNYCHGLITAERKLFKGSPVLGKFYICTDGSSHPEPQAYCYFWKELDKAVVGMGFSSIQSKFHLPFWFLYVIALFCEIITMITGIVFKLNVFNVFVLTMNRWFDISAAENDLNYQPIIPFSDGWCDTIEWFKDNWLIKFNNQRNGSVFGLSSGSQQKIDIQAHHKIN